MRLPGHLSDLPPTKAAKKDTSITGEGGVVFSPGRIRGTFARDFNILVVDDLIKRDLTGGREARLRQAELGRMYAQQEEKAARSIVESKAAAKRREEADRRYYEEKNNDRLANYTARTADLVRRYSALGPLPTIISFRSTEEEAGGETEEKQRERHAVICAYVNIAREFYDVDVYRVVNLGKSCRSCGANMEHVLPEDSGIHRCVLCSAETPVIARTVYLDEDPAANDVTGGYEDRENFRKAFRRYQGKQTVKFPSDLIERLEHHFVARGFPPGDEIRCAPLNPDRTRGESSHELLYEALHALALGDYYDDVNLIGKMYWGWELLDLDFMEEQIMEDYDASQREFLVVKGPRKSSLNIPYRLFRLIQKNAKGFSVYPSEFKIVKTPGTRAYHESIWPMICRRKRWPVPPPLD